MTTIGENTKVTLSTAVTVTVFVGAIIASGAFWLAMLTGSVTAATIKNNEQGDVLKAQTDINAKQLEVNNQILSDLRLIKDRLKIKE